MHVLAYTKRTDNSKVYIVAAHVVSIHTSLKDRTKVIGSGIATIDGHFIEVTAHPMEILQDLRATDFIE